MKHILIFSIILLSISKLNGQVSIGSSTPRDAAILDVTSSTKGVLFPRVELTSLDSKLPLTGNVQNGTLVFNTKPNGTGANKVFTGFYEWYNNKWKLPITESSTYKVAKFVNNPADQTVDWNPSATTPFLNLSLFHGVEFNDDTSVFQKLNDTSLVILQTGTYAITTNIGFQLFPVNTLNSRIEMYIQYALNGVRVSSKVLTRVPQQDGATVDGRFFYNMTDYITVTTPGQILTIQTIRNNASDVSQSIRYDSGVTSSIVLHKLR